MNQIPGENPGAAHAGQRRGIPWWGWALGGCGGCGLLVLIGLVVSFFAIGNFVKEATRDLGPMDEASLQQRLEDVPIYPGSRFDVAATRAINIAVRSAEKLGSRRPGSVFRVAVVRYSSDPPENVLQYYDRTLVQAGWERNPPPATGGGAQQRLFRRGKDTVMVQVQQQPGQGTMITVMRGGPELSEHAPPGAPRKSE